MIERDLAALGALGRIETQIHLLNDLTARLAQVPMWGPAHALAKQAAEAQRLIGQMQARMERRLVVTLIGPSGSGKSTLLNALAGVDDLSPTGHQRPTTRHLLVLANDEEAVRQLFDPMDRSQIHIRSSRAAEALSHMILVDTPDTDSLERDLHLPMIHHAVERSDVLVCVFDAQNPKRRDHADFMAPLVQRFHGASLVAVVNQCDRLEARELTEVIAPEFENYLKQAWDIAPQRLLLVSARRHLQRPQWDPQAAPRHAIDQFDQLRALIFDTFSQPGFGPDRRLANARQVIDYMLDQVRRNVDQHRPVLEQASQQMAVAEKEALRQAVEALRADDQRMVLGVHVRLYQALAQRWVGPVGWLVAIWSRLILFGTGLVALMRFGNPLSQIWGLVSAWRRHKQSGAALEALNDQTRVDTALQAFQRAWWTLWPNIAELLVQGGFDSQVRRAQVGCNDAVGTLARGLWSDALEAEIERSAKALSHGLVQIVFNLPALILMGYVGWLTTQSFLTHVYLSGDFFLHALLTLVVVLLLSFFVFQACARLAVGQERIQRRAFAKIEAAANAHAWLVGREVGEQIEKVLALVK